MDMLKTDTDRTNKLKKLDINRLVASYEQIKKIISEHYICNKEQYYESRVCDP